MQDELYKSYMIVIIEDDEGLNELICNKLNKENFTTIGFTDSNKAFDYILNNKDVLLILDYKLEEMSAKELIQNLRQKNIDVPFIIMTGFGDEQIAVEMMKLGAKDYLVKNSNFLEFLPEVIRRTIRELINEKKIIEYQKSIEESEKKFRTLFETMSQGVIYRNLNCEILEANPSALKILGLTRDELIGRPCPFEKANPIFEDGAPILKENYPCSKVQKICKEVKNLVIGFTNFKTGKRRWINVNATPQFKRGESAPYLIYMTFEDITQRKDAENEVKFINEQLLKINEELNAANEELKSLDKMKTNILSNVSHELRTPLVSVRGYTELILLGQSGPVTEKQKYQLNICLRSIDKLIKLIENLLYFARQHQSGLKIFFEDFNMKSLLDEIIIVLQNKISEKNITIREEISDGEININADRSMIYQVILNLIDNAIKFSEKNSVIKIKIFKQEEQLIFSVQDYGIGIPDNEKEKIFEKFYQVDSSSTRKYGGTGIGLAICKDIIEMHGGKITVESKIGSGSTFSFSIPVQINV